MRLLTFCGALFITAGAGAAGQYPDHPVRLLVGFAAGGPTDVIARIIGQRLSAALGQQFYVDDKPGAGGNIANAEVAKAAPDGYTLAVVSTGFMVNMSLYAKVPYDAVKDFAPITMVAYSPNIIAVNPSVPAESVKELIELIKAMGISVRALLRERGSPYAELGLADPKWSDDQLIDFMLANPILINRPIVVTPKGTKLCRPSEAVLDLLDHPADTFVKEDGEVVTRAKS